MNVILLKNYEEQNVTKTISTYKNVTDGFKMNYYHWHRHYELAVITSGEYTVVNNSRVITSGCPGIFIHCPYSLHKANADPGQNYIRYIISFDRSMKEIFSDKFTDFNMLGKLNLIYVRPNPIELAEITDIAEKLRKRGDDTIASLYIAVILRHVSIILKSGRGEAVTCRLSYIQDALREMSENLAEPRTVQTLSSLYDVGESKFYADFKANTGLTYKKYLTDLRQTRARELLAGGSSIIDASLECGYSSEAHFVKAFREYWGVTPGGYIQRLDSNTCQP